MGTVTEKKQCPECNKMGKDTSKDNLAVYEDGSIYCFACGYTQATQISHSQIKYRGISLKTMAEAHYYKSDVVEGEWIAEYWIPNHPIKPLKIRHVNKKFSWNQKKDIKTSFWGLYDEWDYNKPLYITEGEYDRLSVMECGFQAVSTSSGAGSVSSDLEIGIDILKKFPEIILFLDNDDVGQTATLKAYNILISNNINCSQITNYYNCKDANEILCKDPNLLKKVLSALPEGIILGNEIDIERLKTNKLEYITIPWPKLQESMLGFEKGCFYVFLAGTSVGKSTVLRELVYSYRLNNPNLKILNLFLEENEEITPLAFAALHYNIPLGKLRRDRTLLTNEQWNNVKVNLLNTDKLGFVTAKYKRDSNNILKTIEYFVTQRGYELIIIDHLSYIIGRSGISKHGERRDVDEFMYALQDLVQRLNCIVLGVSHVNDSKSTKRWDEGEVPNIYSGRSSRVLAQIPDGIIGLSRQMTAGQAQDKLCLYNLKNRWFSKLGKMDELLYNNETGRLKPIIDLDN